MSSRPDESLLGWDRFHIYRLGNLSKEQVKLLVEKLPFDPDIKALFFKKLEAGLYETHEEFMVSPLLVIMMLLTLEQFVEIPAKIHLFYEYAFEALFMRHDSTKGGYQRKRKVNLPLDDYRRLFSYFCAMSYLTDTFRFTRSFVLETLEQCISAAQIETDKQAMLDDLEQCTCMLSKDGLEFVFTHRSFQEYFMAYFISRIKTDQLGKIASKLAARRQSDNVLMMISEMNREKFEETWVLPQLSRLWNAVREIDPSANVVEYLTGLSEQRKANLLITFPAEQEINAARSVIRWNQPVYIESNKSVECPIFVFRVAIYVLYGINSKIDKATEATINDVFVLDDIRSGKRLRRDRRFLAIRTKNVSFKEEHILRITAEPRDNKWLIKTSLAEQLSEEKGQLERLLKEVELRVQARRDGLDSIMGLLN
jgi:hypothetical protein